MLTLTHMLAAISMGTLVAMAHGPQTPTDPLIQFNWMPRKLGRRALMTSSFLACQPAVPRTT